MSDHHDHAKGDKHAVHLALVQRLRAQAAEVQRMAAGLDESVLIVSGLWGLVSPGDPIPFYKLKMSGRV